MENKNFHCSITVSITATEAFEKICQVSEWWVRDVEGSTEKLCDEFTVHFGTTWVAFKINELVPDKKIVWFVTDCNLPWNSDLKEWKDTELIWELSASRRGVEVSFTHAGLADLDCGNQCMNSWSGYINQSLLKLITEGEGLPNKF